MRLNTAWVVGCLLAASAPVHAQILSAKRGFADVSASYNNLQATNAGWYYTWGGGVGNPGNFDANHYPMIWGGGVSQNTLNNLVARNPTYLLGFNEPERSDQANLTVETAISDWTRISAAFTGTNTKLVSPAVADTGGAAGGQQWLANFVSQARAANLKLDAIAFHWYGVSTPNDPAAAASAFLGRVQSYYNTYQLPIFITEFAIHDWGGNYTDAEIAEANRQFLNIVIPQLESRSYVAGYAWYHWFGDARLYTGSGNNLTPTPLSYSYIGAVSQNTTANIANVNLGEHVANMTGGTLAMNGSTPGSVKFIHSLAGESSIAGTLDWTLAGSSGNWVRIQSNTRLIKTGVNTITFNNGSVTNNGTLEVAQGTLRLGMNVTGAGDVRVKGGTLALFNNATLAGVPSIDVRTAGTLDVTGLSNGTLTLTSNRTLRNDGTVIGNVAALNGSVFASAGSVNGNVIAQGGSIVRVGTDRNGVVRRSIVDHFDNYSTGDVVTVAPAWRAHSGTTAADIETVNGNNVMSFGATSGFVGVSRQLPPNAVLENDAVGTYFFRINAIADNLNHTLGVGDYANPEAVDFGDYEAQFRLKAGTSAGTFAVDARNGNAFTSTLASGLSLNTWYNVWMVVNNATDRYDIYLNTGDAAATGANKLNAAQLAFRNGTNQDIDSFLAYAGGVPVGNAVRLDALTFMTGVDLTNPFSSFDPGNTWSSQTMTVRGNYTLNNGARLQMDVGSAGTLVGDKVTVIGDAVIDGILSLQQADSFAPAFMESWTLLTASSLTGKFRQIEGMSISDQLALAITYTSSTIQLTVATPGDANLDGAVNFDDLLVLAQNYQSGTLASWATADFTGNGATDFDDLLLLAQHYGSSASFEADWALARAMTPEPASLLSLAVLGVGLRRRR